MSGIRKDQIRKIKEARAAYYETVESGDKKATERTDATYQRVVDNASQEEYDKATE